MFLVYIPSALTTCTDGYKLNAILSQIFPKAVLRLVTNALGKSFVGAFCVLRTLVLFCFESLDLREWELPKK